MIYIVLMLGIYEVLHIYGLRLIETGKFLILEIFREIYTKMNTEYSFRAAYLNA